MRLEIRDKGYSPSIPEGQRQHLLGYLETRLGPYEQEIARVLVDVEALYCWGGGVEWRCQVGVKLEGGVVTLVEASANAPHLALIRACARAEGAVASELERAGQAAG